MAIPRIPTEDVLASIEKYANDNWPDPNIASVPTTHEAFSGEQETSKDAWAAFQWVTYGEGEPNRNGTAVFDMRMVVHSREADRFAATRRADQFVGIFNNVTVTVYDRSDGGSTAVAKAKLETAIASPPSLDDRGIRFSFVDVTGTVFPD